MALAKVDLRGQADDEAQETEHLNRDRPKAAVKRGASLITRLGAVSRAGSCRRRLAERDVTTQRRPPKDGHPENPG
jgi:hypothetical protein